MAIAGSSTTAYRCYLNMRGKLQMGPSRIVGGSVCVKPKAALGILRTGQSVIVAGSDMRELRELVEVLNVQPTPAKENPPTK